MKHIEKSGVRSVDPNPSEDVFFSIFSCCQKGWTYGPINGFMLEIGSHILRFSPSGQNRMVQIPQGRFRGFILLMEEILHQLICSLSHYLQGFMHPRWYRISSINGMDCLPCYFSIRFMFFQG